MHPSQPSTSTPAPPAAHDLPIHATGLTKSYRIGLFRRTTVRALQGLNLQVARGEVFGLLGPNGAGKSTTIKILMNLVQPSTGSALLFGRAPSEPELRREIGFVPENPAPYEYLSGREFVTLSGQLAGLSGREASKRARETLGAVGLDKAEKLPIRRYSKGMVQRVVLAQALVARPSLLVLDEPTSGLDPLGRRLIRDVILEERARGTTVLFCTHIIPDVEALCDRVAVLVGGRLVREGSVQDLLLAQVPSVELTVEGLSPERLGQLGTALESVQPLERRVVVRVPDAESQRYVQAVIAAGGKVSRLQPSRFSLEDLFMSALAEAGRARSSVGGEIS
jgi:ABC-2 type transport system ATP-binding protein